MAPRGCVVIRGAQASQCSPEHPEIVEELTAFWLAWHQASRGRRRPPSCFGWLVPPPERLPWSVRRSRGERFQVTVLGVKTVPQRVIERCPGFTMELS